MLRIYKIKRGKNKNFDDVHNGRETYTKYYVKYTHIGVCMTVCIAKHIRTCTYTYIGNDIHERSYSSSEIFCVSISRLQQTSVCTSVERTFSDVTRLSCVLLLVL